VVEECTIYDLDDIGITISAASDENIVRGCLIFDTVTANAAVYAISCAGDGCTISENEIRTNGTAGIHLAGTLNQLNNNRVSAVGANSIGILLADGATAFGNGNVVTAIAAGNLVDATSDADSPTVFADTGNIYNADPATATFITATVGGS
jgi:parallel beta-helix repeat protein